MLATVLEQESYLFTENELNTFERYKALSCTFPLPFSFALTSSLFSIKIPDLFSPRFTIHHPLDNARYLLIRLLLRTPQIHRQTHLAESYAGEIGKDNITATMDEVCLCFDGSKQPTVAPPGKGKEKEKIVIDLTEDEEHDDPELARALRESLKSFNKGSSSSVGVNGEGKENGVGASVKGKGKEVAGGGGGGGKKLPQAVVDALNMDERPLDLSHFCGAASSGEVGEEKLLRCLKMNELKEVAKAMKVWKTGLTVRSRLVLSLFLLSSHTASLSIDLS